MRGKEGRRERCGKGLERNVGGEDRLEEHKLVGLRQDGIHDVPDVKGELEWALRLHAFRYTCR